MLCSFHLHGPQLPPLKSMLSFSSSFIHSSSLGHFLSNTKKEQEPSPTLFIFPFLSAISMDTQTRTTTTTCNSPEFEFWMLRNPSFPQPNLLSADELFVDGVLLPLHLLPKSETPNSVPPVHDPDPEPGPRPESSPAITDQPSSSTFSASKRWKDIFRKSEKKNSENNNNPEEKEKKKKKKKERKTGSGASSAELNINIWPFTRSRSAGNTGTRPKLFNGAPVTRKVNSAPCSRSNSAGESKSRKWPSSPGRAGVHVGRSSPVWQVRRGGSKSSEKEAQAQAPASRRSKVATAGSTKGRVLNLNVPMCIGYRHQLSCRSDENSGECSNDGGSGGNLFNLRNLFTKKSIVTSN